MTAPTYDLHDYFSLPAAVLRESEIILREKGGIAGEERRVGEHEVNTAIAGLQRLLARIDQEGISESNLRQLQEQTEADLRQTQERLDKYRSARQRVLLSRKQADRFKAPALVREASELLADLDWYSSLNRRLHEALMESTAALTEVSPLPDDALSVSVFIEDSRPLASAHESRMPQRRASSRRILEERSSFGAAIGMVVTMLASPIGAEPALTLGLLLGLAGLVLYPSLQHRLQNQR